MKSIKHLLKRGWYFEYSPETRFISAKHPKGGACTVLEMTKTIHFDHNEVGAAIANVLNGRDPEIMPHCKHFTRDAGCCINYGSGRGRSFCKLAWEGEECDRLES